MESKFVQLVSDVTCEWEGLPPTYRVYVNDELFAERTWIWQDGEYLEEMLQIQAPPGSYSISYELVPPYLAMIRLENMRVITGPASVTNNILTIK